ncbi:MAG: hypothetical protein ACR2QF_10265 [Geminicoccaceae bacterium]
MSNIFIDAGPPASGQKVFLATTAYESPDASYTYSVQSTRQALSEAGIQSAYALLCGNCHVDDARNSIVQEFLLSDCTDLMFIDADVSWEPEDLVSLCQRDRALIGGVYPFRREDMRGTGAMPVRLIHDASSQDGLLEVEGLPAGFMRIRRSVLEQLADLAESYWNRTDRRSKVPLLFERDLINGERWSGDLNFCRKWRAVGGKVYADSEIPLGHIAKTRIVDSLAASFRRLKGQSLRHCAGLIRDRVETPAVYREALAAVDNPWAAGGEVLAASVLMARSANGPILEMGSGISTVLMAAATDQTVWCVEHDGFFASRLEAMARSAGVSNIALVTCPLKDDWYDLSEDMGALPDRFALALVDGPPRYLAKRMPFFETFGHCSDVIVCDDANEGTYAVDLRKWADIHSREIRIEGSRLAIIMPRQETLSAA